MGRSMLRPYKILSSFSGQGLCGGFEFRLVFCGASGQPALFFGDGFRVDEPLAVAGAAGLLLL